jgi:hypothetical protein
VTNQLDNYEYTIGIIEEMNLEKIDITKTMYNKLAEILNENNDYIKKYIIKDKTDLYNDNIINFYYILFKYILKNSFYIYQNNFLFAASKNLRKLYKKYYLFGSSINNKNKDKLDYIFKFCMTGYDYYENEKKRELYIMLFEKKIHSSNKKKNEYENRIESVDFIKEISNGYIILGSENDVFYIYDNMYQKKKTINYKNGLKKEEAATMSKDSKTNKDNCKRAKNIVNINYNETNRTIEYIECSNFHTEVYKINDKYNITRNGSIDLNSSNYFKIEKKNSDNNNYDYIIIGEKGLYHFNDSPFKISYREKKYNKDKKNFNGSIKINDNYLVLTSNSILPKGEDILVFYDIKMETIIYPKNEMIRVCWLLSKILLNGRTTWLFFSLLFSPSTTNSALPHPHPNIVQYSAQ